MLPIAEPLDWRDFADSLPQIVWAADPAGKVMFFNQSWYEFTGAPVGDPSEWLPYFHPDERAAIAAQWAASVASGNAYEIEYRLRHRDGSWHWYLSRGRPTKGADGQITGWLGTCTDIEALKSTEAQRNLIARELSHRIRNIFAVVGALITLSARGQPALSGFADGLQRRLAALATAHDLVRPAGGETAATPTTLQALLAALLQPYEHDRVRLGGDDFAIGSTAATSLSLLFHELATNAVKHGALGPDGGEVVVMATADGARYRIIWEETGGPRLSGPPTATGFGSQLSRFAIAGWPGATLATDWREAGLLVTLVVPAMQLVA